MNAPVPSTGRSFSLPFSRQQHGPPPASVRPIRNGVQESDECRPQRLRVNPQYETRMKVDFLPKCHFPRRSNGTRMPEERPLVHKRSECTLERPADCRQRPPLRTIVNATGQRGHVAPYTAQHPVHSCDCRYYTSPTALETIPRSSLDRENRKPRRNPIVASSQRAPEEQPDMGCVSDREIEKLGDAACVEEALLQVMSKAISSFKARHREYLCREGQAGEYCPYPAAF